MARPTVDLLCFPWAGASATMYLRWQRKLPSWIRVVPIELAGRGGRLDEPFVEDFDTLVAVLCDEQNLAMQGCYALFGHSMGALVAYAIAHERRARKLPLPCAVFASGSAAPSRLRDTPRAVHTDEALIAELRVRGGTPEEVFHSHELLPLALAALRADYRVCDSFRYKHAAPLPVALHVFGGALDEIAAEDLDAWRIETSGPFTVDWFGGGHFFIRKEEQPVLNAVVRELGRHAPQGGSASIATV